MELLLDSFYQSHDEEKIVRQDGNKVFFEFSRSFGAFIGIRVCGVADETGYHRQYYFPYVHSVNETTSQAVLVEEKADGNGFFAESEDGRVDFALIYFLQNPADYLRCCLRGSIPGDSGAVKIPTSLSALASRGTILLPARDREIGSFQSRRQFEFYANHVQTVIEAKNGNQDAVERLTMEDMDTYDMVTRRLRNENILSIIDTYFMPYGMESDQYQIMGTILLYTKFRNEYTNETLYHLTVECNDLMVDVCINSLDLYGEPAEGRRFKGNIWLQGEPNFSRYTAKTADESRDQTPDR